jgi:hypothetical protein
MQSKITDGDIIVFHDAGKAFPRLEYALPKTLQYFSENGYQFLAISDQKQ